MNWFGKVDQARNRFFVLIISFLVLVVTLAGLMGILDILPQPVGPGASPNGDLPASSQTEKPEGPLPEPVTVQPTVGISSDFSLKADQPPSYPGFRGNRCGYYVIP